MGPDDPPGASDPRVWIVRITRGSAHPVAAVADALRAIADVAPYGVDSESWRLRVAGAPQDAVEDALQPFDGRSIEIVHPDDWRTRTRSVTVAWLDYTRLAEQVALTMTTNGITGDTSVLVPDVRDDLVNALMKAFPSASDLDLVFDLRTGDNPGMATEGRPLRNYYNSVVGELLKSLDRFDRFLCGALRENPGNHALRNLVEAEFDRCDTCGCRRITCEKVR